MTATETGFLAAIFREARTFSHWQARPVPEAMVESAFELACLGPTSANCQPLRLVLVRSPAAKERLLPCVSSGNYEKVRAPRKIAARNPVSVAVTRGLHIQLCFGRW